ncbi:hypothetical protein OQJ26_01260 [Legionella sp. PATHC038]|uniref:hypothetical protein n=1 Tax=Legionella sheltonii TaxID=2992041 RepID=UPI0022442C1E|nr:hypothetical protein [Legionella sp. PATHC038]MCW8397423.1 hypothetical protein [Legionella sp. PATHC038]
MDQHHVFCASKDASLTNLKYEVEKMNSKEEYYIGVCVKDTNQENGPGHVSTFVHKVKDDTPKTHHFSLFPGLIGSILNGLSFGSIPVQGQYAQDHKEDIKEANDVLLKKVSKEQYKKAKQAQKEIKKEVDNNQCIYSVFGEQNPLASAFTKLFTGGTGAKLSIENHQKENGCFVPEDFDGSIGTLYRDHHHPTSEPKIKVENCASSVTKILNQANISVTNPQIPTFFKQVMQEQGFVNVKKENLSTFGIKLD